MHWKLGKLSVYAERSEDYTTCPVCDAHTTSSKVELSYGKFWWGRNLHIGATWMCDNCSADGQTWCAGVKLPFTRGDVMAVEDQRTVLTRLSLYLGDFVGAIIWLVFALAAIAGGTLLMSGFWFLELLDRAKQLLTKYTQKA